jgi:hypothetical protein
MMNLFSRFNERGVLVHRASACLPRFFFFYLVRIAYRHAHPRSTPARRDRYPCRYRTQ